VLSDGDLVVGGDVGDGAAELCVDVPDLVTVNLITPFGNIH
jgi:hypothetical protein